MADNGNSMIATYRKIFDLLTPRERRRFFFLLLMILVMSLLDVAGVASIIPFLAVLGDPEVIQTNAYLSFAYNQFSFSSENNFLFFFGVSVFFLIVFGLAFKALTLYALIKFSTMRNYSISSRLLRGYLSQPYTWFLNRHSADLGKTILSEVDHVIQGSIIPAVTMLAHIAVIVALTTLLFFVDPTIMAIATASIAGTYGLVFVAVRKLLSRIGEKRVNANSRRFQMANEAIGGIKDVKLLGLEKSYIGRFRQPAEVFARTQALSQIIGSMPRFILELLCFGGMLTILLVLIVRNEGRLEDLIPVLGVFAFAGVRMFPVMQQLYVTFTKLRFGKYALDAMHRDFIEVADLPIEDHNGGQIHLTDRLELDRVHFAYPGVDRDALDGVTLTVRANRTIGVVGGSGAGKTTIVDLILGLLSPRKGGFWVDGELITQDNRRAWQRSIGYVPQSIFLTDDTIRSNIAFGVPPEQIDDNAVERAAKLADLHHFVASELPKRYQTLVGERGVRLSGGQRQRIGIARALYHDPDVLVFDEATSALDNVTEKSVMDAVNNLAGAKTIIIVAHRLSTISSCSEIVVMQDGKISAVGSFDELRQSCPAFQELVDAAA